MERLNMKEKEERRNKIEESNYNSIYKEMLEAILGYIQGKKKRKDRMMTARYRCGNKMREGTVLEE